MLKKFTSIKPAFKKKVQEERQGQLAAAEVAAKLFKPVTKAELGKEPDTTPLSANELKKLQKKGLLGLLGEKKQKAETETAVKKIVEQAEPYQKLLEKIEEERNEQIEKEEEIESRRIKDV